MEKGGSTARIRGLVVDFGGVVILPHNSPARQMWPGRIGRHNDEFERWLWQTPEATRALRGELAPDEFWEGIGSQLGLWPAESRARAADYRKGDQVNEPLMALVRAAKGKGLRVRLLSNAYTGLASCLRDRQLDGLFDVQVIPALVGMIKPDPEIYRLTAQRLGIPCSELLFLDDNMDNVVSARQAGLNALRCSEMETIAGASSLLGLESPRTGRAQLLTSAGPSWGAPPSQRRLRH